ncbi:MAG TPA: transglutaminase family protein [Ferruginibacter sp.]|nr:transglutaminase family protein [Ferruginibacter sp.]HMP19873.1 transglutaminase family protein [Ferruginibacter sp.]
MPRFVIHHVTRYTYAEPVRDSANQIMLYPQKDERQEVQSQRLHITGEPRVEVFRDYYNNEVGYFMHVPLHTELKIDSTIAVITKPIVPPSDNIDIAQQWKHLQEIKYTAPFIDFLKQEQFVALNEVKELANIDTYKAVSVYTAVKQLNEYVYNNFKYIKGVTGVETTVDEIWKLKAGVCQDFAHILLVLLRMLDIPSRYVSGYVCPHDHTLRGEGATHAWVEAYIPYYGWLGLDPTNNCVVNDLHVRLAVGRSFSDVSPVRGTYKGTAKQALEVGVSVSHEDGVLTNEFAPVLTPQPVTKKENGGTETNSYRRYMQMVQQQQ